MIATMDPPWIEASFQYVNRLRRSGLHIRTLKLTAEQASYLEHATGQRNTMWGYPVQVAAHLSKPKTKALTDEDDTQLRRR